MGLSLWKCDEPGCKSTAVGSGGAVGLRAVGWYFLPGPFLRCPNHRPDPAPCHQEGNTDNTGKTCSNCAAEDEARRLQQLVHNVLGVPRA
jgi:hypothetical protein